MMPKPGFPVWLAVLAMLLAPARAQPADIEQQRVALVIGNAAYASSPLRNPVNDARAVASALERHGFAVIRRENLRAKEIGATLREFRSKVTPGAVAVFFYAGHGLQVKGTNYLPAVDADIDSEDDVPTQSMSLSAVLELLEDTKSRVNLVFLDACRNNPFSRRFRSASRGLAKVDAPSGTLISFATRPGSVAADGDGRNGLYTEKLLRRIDEPDVPIEQMLKRVGADVKVASKGQQEPWSEGLIEGDFYFTRKASAAPAPQQNAPAAMELAFWDAIKDSKRADEFALYLEKYPNGHFASIARARQAAALPRAAEPAAGTAPGTETVTAATAPKTGAFSQMGRLRAQVPFAPGDLRRDAFVDVLRKIESATGGRVAFEAPQSASASVLIDDVGSGSMAAAWLSPLYAFSRDSAFAIVDGPPFGPDASGYAAWRSDRDVAAIVDSLYRTHGVVGVPCGVTAPHGDIWAKKVIAKVDDLRGLKLSALGLHNEIFRRLGATVVPLSEREVADALQRGVVDAAVSLHPRLSQRFGYADGTSVYMVAQFNGARGLDLIVNAALWDRLPASSRNAIVSVCRSKMDGLAAESELMAAEAIREMKSTVKFYKMPDPVMKAIRESWGEVAKNESARNPSFARLHDSIRHFDSGEQRPNLGLYGL